MDQSQFYDKSVHVMGVPKNYLKVTDLTFYYPYDLQSGVDVGNTEDG